MFHEYLITYHHNLVDFVVVGWLWQCWFQRCFPFTPGGELSHSGALPLVCAVTMRQPGFTRCAWGWLLVAPWHGSESQTMLEYLRECRIKTWNKKNICRNKGGWGYEVKFPTRKHCLKRTTQFFIANIRMFGAGRVAIWDPNNWPWGLP